MVRHVSVRVVWHDSGWSGRICGDPDANIYCRGNHSLLSPRIQRRIDLHIEGKFVGQVPRRSIAEKGYLPIGQGHEAVRS